MTLYLGFVDFEKAFDSIHRESLWIIRRKCGIPKKIVRMVKLFCDGLTSRRSRFFTIKTGVKQGCNTSGFLFLIVMNWVMRRAVGSGKNGIRWKV